MNEAQLEILAKALREEWRISRGVASAPEAVPIKKSLWWTQATALGQALDAAAWCTDMDDAPTEGTFDVITDYGLECVMKRGYGDKIVRNVTCRRCDGMGLGSLVAWRPRPPAPGEAMSVIERFTAERLARQLSLRKASKTVGVSFSTLARAERGEGQLTAESERAIRRWLGDAVPWVPPGVDQMPPFIPMPASKEHAEAMIVVAQQYLDAHP